MLYFTGKLYFLGKQSNNHSERDVYADTCPELVRNCVRKRKRQGKEKKKREIMRDSIVQSVKYVIFYCSLIHYRNKVYMYMYFLGLTYYATKLTSRNVYRI